MNGCLNKFSNTRRRRSVGQRKRRNFGQILEDGKIKCHIHIANKTKKNHRYVGDLMEFIGKISVKKSSLHGAV